MDKYNAVLLLGPTGAGKTPLGEYLNKQGIFNKGAFHFDFGANLRIIESLFNSGNLSELQEKYPLLKEDDIRIITESLKNGTLLEDDQFYIAENILLSFIRVNNISTSDLIVLNGLPRHTGQAEKIDKILKIISIIHLNCSDETVYKRIQTNSGGDRIERVDDSFEEVKLKLEIFKERTLKLIEYYKKIKIFSIEITDITVPGDIYMNIMNNQQLQIDLK